MCRGEGCCAGEGCGKTPSHPPPHPSLPRPLENDTMTDADGSKQLYQRASSTDKTLRLVNHMWHVLVREDGNEKVCAAVGEWVLAHT